VDNPAALRVSSLTTTKRFGTFFVSASLRSRRSKSSAEAADGAEAVELALALRPEVVLLDIAMPRLDGFEAATRTQESLPHATVVMHSGEMTPHNLSRAGDLELPLLDKLRLETLLEILRSQAKPSSSD